MALGGVSLDSRDFTNMARFTVHYKPGLYLEKLVFGQIVDKSNYIWVVVSNIFYFHAYLGK